jgi:hypothetical protein
MGRLINSPARERHRREMGGARTPYQHTGGRSQDNSRYASTLLEYLMGLWICYSVTILTLSTLLMSYYPVSVAYYISLLPAPALCIWGASRASFNRQSSRPWSSCATAGEGVLGVGDG